MSSSRGKASERSEAQVSRASTKNQRQARTTGAAASVLDLQRAAGNQAVTQLIRRGMGQPLESGTRQEMESKFGADFGEVRIHSDASAARAAQLQGARAVTLGRDIAFNRDFFSPHTSKGKELLAHELAHVVQQSRGMGRSAISDSETDARDAAANVAAGDAANIQGSAGVGTQADSLSKEELQQKIVENEQQAATAASQEELDSLFREHEALTAQANVPDVAQTSAADAVPQIAPEKLTNEQLKNWTAASRFSLMNDLVASEREIAKQEAQERADQEAHIELESGGAGSIGIEGDPNASQRAGVDPQTPLISGMSGGGDLVPGLKGPYGTGGFDADLNAYGTRWPGDQTFSNLGSSAEKALTDTAADTAAGASEAAAAEGATVVAPAAEAAVAPAVEAGGLAGAFGAGAVGGVIGFFGPAALGYAVQHSAELNEQPDPDEVWRPGVSSPPGGAPPQTQSAGDAGVGEIHAPGQSSPAPALDPDSTLPSSLPSNQTEVPATDPTVTDQAQLPGQSSEQLETAGRVSRPKIPDSVVLEAWKRALKRGRGVVRDPNTREILDPPYLDKNGKLRRDWHMGHKFGHEFWRLERMYELGLVSKAVLRREYQNPAHYAPELPEENVSHEHESFEEWLYRNKIIRGVPRRRRLL